MISVCILTYNGERFIKAQLESILSQLSENDEIIVSDDGSTDATIKIINSLNDSRIKIINNAFIYSKYKGTMNVCFRVGRNAENALKHASGNYIFLADQDDIWLPNKIEVCLTSLQKNDLVITNHIPVNSTLEPLIHREELPHIQKPNLLNTLLHTQFLGCCMALRRELLDYILPFPSQPIMHDIWIGLMALKHGKIGLIQEPYLLYRRHGENASSNIESKSSNSLSFKIMYRIYLLQAYLKG